MGTHGFSENPYPYPPKTRTRDQGYRFLQVRVRVWAEIPWGYLWQAAILAWPGYPGLGLAFQGSGLVKCQAQAVGRAEVELGLGLA